MEKRGVRAKSLCNVAADKKDTGRGLSDEFQQCRKHLLYTIKKIAAICKGLYIELRGCGFNKNRIHVWWPIRMMLNKELIRLKSTGTTSCMRGMQRPFHLGDCFGAGLVWQR